MIDPSDPVTPTSSASPVQAPAATPAPGPRPEPRRPEARRPDPLTLEVQRGDDGVYVYRLTDPSTGRLLAVIPGAGQAAKTQDYRAGGFVSLKA